MRGHSEDTGAKDALAPAGSQTTSLQRILVVEDDRIIRQLYSNVLIGSGYQVDSAEDGDEGWEVLHAVNGDPDSYNLLITDNNMPKMSGVELVEKLRSERVALPVIMASGTPPPNTKGLYLDAILLKPFPIEKLVHTVKEVLHCRTQNSATPRLKKIARRLLSDEAASGKPAGAKDSAAFLVCEKLREPLGKFMDVGSFRSFLSRALALAGVEVPWLRALQIKADGSLESFEHLRQNLNPAAAEGEVVLVSQLLGLLVTFLGPALTLRLLNEIWPKMDELKF